MRPRRWRDFKDCICILWDSLRVVLQLLPRRQRVVQRRELGRGRGAGVPESDRVHDCGRARGVIEGPLP